MNLHTATHSPQQNKPAFTPIPKGLLQRKCACGGSAGLDGECEECRDKRLQRRAADGAEPTTVPPMVHEVLRSPGQPLDQQTRAFFEPRFGHDFSKVRVHTDARAGESARAVNALAYTVGREIIFEANQYAPATSTGQRLLAHELTHVVQQRDTDVTSFHAEKESSVSSQIGFEAEADNNIQNIVGGLASVGRLNSVEPAIMRREGQRQQQQRPGCTTDAQNSAIDEARAAAAVRCQVAYFRLAGLVAPGPPGREQYPSRNWRMRARMLVRKIFNEDVNMDQVAEIVGQMRDRLSSASLPVVCAGNNDQHCGNRVGYVVGRQPPIHLCPNFFASGPEERIRTMIHEAAHLAGIGEAQGESYCVIFDCENSCGGFNVADSWSHFVHCLSGQPADQPEVIEGRQP